MSAAKPHPLDDDAFETHEGDHYEPGRYYPATCQVPKSFSKGLRQVGGTTPDGRSKLRCLWGMDIKWLRGGKLVARYVMSTKLNRIERTLPSGLTTVSLEMQYFGTPRFIVEEWHPSEMFVPKGSGIDAEKDWENFRFERFYQRWGEPLNPPSSAADYLYKMRQSGIDPKPDEMAVIYQAYNEGQKERLPKIPVLEKVLLDTPIDKVGAFPRGGRYDYMCKLPVGRFSFDEWLEVIKRTYARRAAKRFVSIEAEVADIVAQDQAQRDKVGDKIEMAIADNLRTHAHRFFTSTPNKGGSGSRVFLPGKG